MNPLVSVILPVYNGEKYIEEALHSILKQIFPADEIIVVDDGSTDCSSRIAAACSPSIRVLHQDRRGAGAARNVGVQCSQGAFLAFLDADDLWPPGKLQIEIEAFRNDPLLDLVFGGVRPFLSPELDAKAQGSLYCPEENPSGYVMGTMLAKKESFLKVGPLTESLKIGEFVDWYARARELGLKAELVPEILLHRRIHLHNTTRLERDSKADYLHVLKASLDRKRAASHD